MLEVYTLNWLDTQIGTFIRYKHLVDYVPFHEGASSLPEGFGYPDGLFILDRSVTPWRVIKTKPRNSAGVTKWLGRRVFPRERENATMLLKHLGLVEYDIWEILKKTGGVLPSDSYTVFLKKSINIQLDILETTEISRNINHEILCLQYK